MEETNQSAGSELEAFYASSKVRLPYQGWRLGLLLPADCTSTISGSLVQVQKEERRAVADRQDMLQCASVLAVLSTIS